MAAYIFIDLVMKIFYWQSTSARLRLSLDWISIGEKGFGLRIIGDGDFILI